MVGVPVAKLLASKGKYNLRIQTRDPNHERSRELAMLPNTTLVEGRADNEADLRRAFEGVTAAFVNTNGFAIGEKAELYWGMRIFEIAKEWQDNSFTALMTWIEGAPLREFTEIFPLLAEDQQESSAESLAIRWIRSTCEALGVLHRHGLVLRLIPPAAAEVIEDRVLCHAVQPGLKGRVDRLVTCSRCARECPVLGSPG